MINFQVSANGQVFGTYEADSEQGARDLCAQDAGYKSEADMAGQLARSSDLVATQVEEWKAWEDGGESVSFFAPVGGTLDIAESGAAALGVDVSEAINVARV